MTHPVRGGRIKSVNIRNAMQTQTANLTLCHISIMNSSSRQSRMEHFAASAKSNGASYVFASFLHEETAPVGRDERDSDRP